MRNYICITLLLVVFTACKQTTKPEEPVSSSEEKTIVLTKKYPKDLQNIFNAHGGIEAWKSMKSLAFTIEKPNGDEIISTNLNSREALLENPKTTIGFDGKKVWLLNKTSEKYKGSDPKYVYNLMFYFYAMPFVLSDDGINYANAEPLIFEGKTYPGIEITYNNDVGATPQDRYVLYYNSETYQMEWLGYTVSFIEGIDKKELHFRRYNDWKKVNGLMLPQSITGYAFKDDKPTEAKQTNVFKNIIITEKAFDSSKFSKPKNAKFID
ncbi:hypothetical protein MC378_09495 [Polaribacter sp. MSW13]|uniref:Threonine synthase n=1 Tax=Polaribacter marinus TaxID=2916838 RepID=A0A9X1VNM0_9FLAO|nr:DUF6503 family protein [Polaribacter marinus]MCI2229398.1 hypothetical protein [Polaribacter marinus]